MQGDAIEVSALGIALIRREFEQCCRPRNTPRDALHKKAAQERSEVSGLKEVLANLEDKHQKLRDTVARHGDELAETRRHNLELGEHLQQPEEENRLLRKSSEGLKGELARVEVGQQNAVARLQEAITAGGWKVKEDLGNVQGELAKMKEEIRAIRLKPELIAPPDGDITAPPPLKAASPAMTFSNGSPPPNVAAPPPRQIKQFPPSLKEGTGGYDVADGIIAYVTMECGGNVHDHYVVDITSGSFEKETERVNPPSGAYNSDPRHAAKNAADLESDSESSCPTSYSPFPPRQHSLVHPALRCL
jgi:hypothetical protein